MDTEAKEKEAKGLKAKVGVAKEPKAKVEREAKADLHVKHKDAVKQLHTQARLSAPPASRKSSTQDQSQRRMGRYLNSKTSKAQTQTSRQAAAHTDSVLSNWKDSE